MNEVSTVSEYATVRVTREMEPLCRDAYRAFGWDVTGDGDTSPESRTVTLTLTRDRRLKNRPMIVELQRKGEDALAAIAHLERSKTTTAAAAAVAVGTAGAVLLAGSIITLTEGSLGWSVPLGVLGLIAWTLSRFTYARVKARRAARLAPLIERQLETVREACDQAGHLIY